MRIRLPLLATLLMAAAGLSAQPVSFARDSREIRAGLLLVDSQRIAGRLWNPAPHALYALDQDVAVKPASWRFTNPLGQTSMTGSMLTRWAGDPTVPGLGSILTKRAASYWEVVLAESSDTALSAFDVLLLPAAGAISLRADERERLRRFMDQGGTLWVDVIGGAAFDPVNTLPIPFEAISGSAATEANLSHPLLSRPNLVSLEDLIALRGGGTVLTRPVLSLNPSLNSLLATIRPDGDKLEGVGGNSDGFIVSYGSLGAGRMVVTSFGLSRILGRAISGSGGVSPNLNFSSGESVQDTLFLAGAKLVFNMLSSASAGSPGGSSRKSNTIPGDVTAPLLREFSVPGGSYSPGTEGSLFRGYAYMIQGGVLYCFDAKPSRDINGDGNPDDGLPDAVGTSQDLVWSFNLGASASSPVAFDLPESLAGTSPLAQVWTVASDGRIHGFDALTGVRFANIDPPSGGVDSAVGPFAPTLHEGMLFVAEGRSSGFGRIRVIDPGAAVELELGGNGFRLEGTGRIESPTASATVGYIPIADGSGGLDRVVYLAAKSRTSSSPAVLSSIWLGAKGETPNQVTRSGSTLTLRTRASLQGLPLVISAGSSPLGLRITAIRPDTGRPMTQADMTANMTGAVVAGPANGEINVTLQAAPNPAWDWDGQATPGDATDDVGWRVDYTIDWSRSVAGTPNADAFVRGVISPSDSSTNGRQIVGSPALTSKGHVILATTVYNPGRVAPDTSVGGTTVWNLREEGRGEFVLVNRFDLLDSLNFQVNSGGPSSVVANIPTRETIIDEDELLTQLPGFLASPILDLRVSAAPCVVGDSVFLSATGFKNLGFGFAPTTVLISLEAHPPAPQFVVQGLTESDEEGYVLVQPDPARSTTKNAPEQLSVLPRSAFRIEPLSTGRNLSLVTLNSLSASRTNLRDSVTTSLPILVRRSNNSTDTAVEPEATTARSSSSGNAWTLQPGQAGGRWSPLSWYFVANGMHGTAGPLAAGRTLYLGGGSYLPSILVSGLGGLQENGVVYALDAEVSSNDPFLKSNSVRGWFNQLSTVVRNSLAAWDVRPSPTIQWPQFEGIRSIDDLRVRILQNTVSSSRTIGMTVGEDAVATFADGGPGGASFNVFQRAQFLVVDSQRVSRFDSSGNPTWVLSGTSNSGPSVPISAASRRIDLAEPTRAYPDGSDATWVVDPGSNRIVMVDRAGRELRLLRGFNVHPTLAPAGFTSGDPQRFSSPRDVMTYSRSYTAAQVAAAFPGETLAAAATDEVWRHILVADTGNRRAVELVDRFRVVNGRIADVVTYRDHDGSYVPAYGVLVWHSPEELSGGQFAYNSIARINDPTNSGNRVTAFGFGITEPGPSTVGLDSPNAQAFGATGSGGVVIYNGPDTVLLTSFSKPAIPANAYLMNDSGTWRFMSPALPQVQQKVSGLTSVTLRREIVGGSAQLHVMICDNTGVYELVQTNPTGPTPADRSQWAVRWMLPVEAYTFMRRNTLINPSLGYAPGDLTNNPLGFRPMHAQRLASGEILVVNGYLGRTFGPSSQEFQGEVVLLEGRYGDAIIPGYNTAAPNLGFNSLSVRYELPPVVGVRGLIRPIFAARQ